MKENYTLHVLQDEDQNFFHCVFEEPTQQVIGFYYFLDDAKEVADFMNSGGAFDGFTPHFMLNDVNIDYTTEELNSVFDRVFG